MLKYTIEEEEDLKWYFNTLKEQARNNPFLAYLKQKQGESMNTTNYNWGEALKVEVGDLTKVTASEQNGDKPKRAPINEGRHAATLIGVKHGTFKKGSYGLTFEYVLESSDKNDNGRTIKEYVVLRKADGSNTPYGASTMKRRLMAFGLPLEKINAFKPPRNEHDLGDFKLALSAPVTVIVKADGEYEGRPSRKVAGVYLREVAA